MFNDTLQLYFNDDVEGEVEIQQIRKGIAWASDLKYRYKNPPEFYNRNNTIWEKFSSPKGWSEEMVLNEFMAPLNILVGSTCKFSAIIQRNTLIL